MTTLFNLTSAEDPQYARIVNFIKNWASVENARAKLPLKNGENCECSVDVPNDHKKWTEEDLTKIASSKFGYDIYDSLHKLAFLAQETTTVTDKSGNKKVVAKNPEAMKALAELAPEGMNANQFYQMIVRVNINNYDLVQKTKAEGIKWDTDQFLFFMKQDYNITKLDKKTIIDMKTDMNPDYARQFSMLRYLSDLCEETEADKRPTETAAYVRQKLSSISANGKWQLIYDTVRETQNESQLKYFGDQVIEYFQKNNLPKLSKQNVEKLITKPETIPAFELVFLLADHAKDKSNVDGGYSLGAIAAQNALKKLSADGKWEALQAEIMRVYKKAPKAQSLNLKEAPKFGSVIDVSEFQNLNGVSLADSGAEQPAQLDKKKAQDALAKSGVSVQSIPSDKAMEDAIAHGLAALQASKETYQRAA